MRAPLIPAFLILILLGGSPLSALEETAFEEKLEEIHSLQQEANLSLADEAVNDLKQNAPDLTPEQLRALDYELERSRRIRLDYGKTESEVKEGLKKKLTKGVYSRSAFNKWKEQGFFDYRKIDGKELRYLNSSVPNFFHRNRDIKSNTWKAEDEWEDFIYAEAKRVVEEVKSNPEGMANPRQYELWMRISVNKGVVKQGETIRLWMPFALDFKYQTNVDFQEAVPNVSSISPMDFSPRSLYFEQPAGPEDQPNEFYARWKMTRYPQYTEIIPANVPEKQDLSIVQEFTEQKPPHVVFTPELIALEKQIAGSLTNPAEKARAYYDWISTNIKYSFAHEYSTVHNISEFVRSKNYGDCGQISLLFITLCRIGGVPARWSSGWVIGPMDTGMHDWAEIYLEPYGWVHVDANWAIFIERDFANYTREQKDFLKNFYFGGIDAYRLTINRDHGMPHMPEKTDFRSDNVDFQRGEIEAGGKNIYFSDFTYKLNIQYLDGHNKASGAFD